MKYYERHIGDYLKDTAHLSLLEHGVYGRLLDVYYTREAPIPASDVARLVGARSREERAALDVVLQEFFTRDGDAWRHARCDREISDFNSGQPERDLKKVNENNRMKRHREERARLFKALTDAGGHADWNTKTSELREIVKRISTAREPLAPPSSATAPATPATATHSPLPITQYPKNQGEDVEHQKAGGISGGPAGPARAGLPEWPDAGAGAAVAEGMRAAGLPDVSPTHPRLLALLAAGLTQAELVEAARVAVAQGKGFAWAMARAEGQRRDAAAVVALPDAEPAADPDSAAAINADALRLGLGTWERVDAKGRTVLWAEFAARVKAARAAERGGVAA